MQDFCPLAETAALIGDVHVLLIVRDLADGPRRFTALHHSLALNSRTLSERLRRMEADGLVSRCAFSEIPPRVEYSLTERGRALLPILEAMRTYGEAWLSGEPARTEGCTGSGTDSDAATG